jgi:K+-transporting ATPase ATPase A chain
MPSLKAKAKLMNVPQFLQYVLFVGVIVLCVKPVGLYLYRVFEGERTFLDPLLLPVERASYRLMRIDPAREMGWKEYAAAFVVFSLLASLVVALILLLQSGLPGYDAQHMATPMTFDLALNAGISFTTTTTWQAYAGETTMSYLSQMVGLVTGNFVGGAAGLAVGIAFIRGLVRERRSTLGNFWVDLVRALLWVLLPLSIVSAVIIVWQGVPMNFNPYTEATTVEGNTQTIAQGPVAALETIEHLGTNGGGFFNVNNAHPYQAPTSLANLLEMLMIAVLPASLTYTFGRMAKKPAQGWLLLAVMTFLFIVGLVSTAWAEQTGNPQINALGVDAQLSGRQSGGNMEGKEVRFGIHSTVLNTVTTSNTATGSYNSMHDSDTPLGGMVALVNMLLGELIYGGLGSGIYSIIVFVLISVFVGGLMVGRTPEYLGKQVSIEEMKLIGVYSILGAATVLILAAVAVVTDVGRASQITNQGPHGFTEIVVAYATSFANNGLNFAGLNGNTLFYNVTTAIAMLVGRFGLGVVALAIAGCFAEQRCKPASLGTLSTTSLTFAVLLIGVILVVGALSYFPTLALGPIVEHLTMGT